MYKRKRAYSYGGATIARYGGPYGNTRHIKDVTPGRFAMKKYKRSYSTVPGRTRIGGYYGRFPPVGVGYELKFFDGEINDVVVDSAQINVAKDSLNKIPQNTTEQGRIGRKCTIKNIFWRYRIYLAQQDAGATPPQIDTIRIIMYHDKQANGATAAGLDILETNSVHAFRNLANIGRFTVLFDKVHVMNYNSLASDGAGVVSAGGIRQEHTMFKKCSIPIEFDNTAGAMVEIKSNNIGVILLSAAGAVGFTSNYRLRFSDK